MDFVGKLEAMVFSWAEHFKNWTAGVPSPPNHECNVVSVCQMGFRQMKRCGFNSFCANRLCPVELDAFCVRKAKVIQMAAQSSLSHHPQRVCPFASWSGVADVLCLKQTTGWVEGYVILKQPWGPPCTWAPFLFQATWLSVQYPVFSEPSLQNYRT